RAIVTGHVDGKRRGGTNAICNGNHLQVRRRWRRGRVAKVADFGLAKLAEGSGSGFTQSGMGGGTPFYIDPEQCEAKPLDPRSDIYSLGATYYSLLTGKNPYADSDSVPQLMYAHCHSPIPDPRSII